MSPRLRKEEENFIRMMRVIFKEVRNQLLSLFLSEFESKYGRRYENDAASGTFFLSQIPRDHRCRDREVKRKIQNGDSTEFDSTTLFYCLLNSDALQQPPMRPRNARMLPLRSSELIDQLRDQRNQLAHAVNVEIDDADFNTRVDQLETIYQRMGWSLQDLRNEACNPLITAWSFRQREALLPLVQRGEHADVRRKVMQILEGMLSQIKFGDLVIRIILCMIDI